MIGDPVASWMLGEIVGCGDCVMFNRYDADRPADREAGQCPFVRPLNRSDEPCRRFYDKTELNRPLYGRRL